MGLPISQARVHGDTVYVSGQVGIDPDTGEMVDGGVEAQARQILTNIESILDAADSSFEDILKATVFIEDMDNFEAVNEVYEEFVVSPYPARSAIEAGLAMGFEVEIEVIAAR